MKKVCVITATRAEYGLLYPLIGKIDADEQLQLQLIVSGTHLNEKYGYTKSEIEDDGFWIAKEIAIPTEGTDACAVSESMGNALIKFAEYLKENRPDIAVILGDRYEMMAFAIALVNEKIPIAHLNGGETTEGALDEVYRHCITKMSTLHFTNCEVHQKRVIQLGENPERVFNVGDICIENIIHTEFIDREELGLYLGLVLEESRTAVVTYHPVTTEDDSSEQLEQLLTALRKFPELRLVFTKANADCGGRNINRCLEEFVQQRPGAVIADSLGRIRYLSLLRYSAAVIGNSSSGLYEAPAFHIPTVNIGNRQKGRLHGATVLDCRAEASEIEQALNEAFDPAFREKCRTEENIWGDGHTSEQIVEILKLWLCGGINGKKEFYDMDDRP